MALGLNLPPINKTTRILSFDLETNGLHGQAFAVGAVLMNASSEILDKFSGRTEIKGDLDPWVEKNVIPAISDMPVNHHSYNELKESFWKWYLAAKPKCDYVLVNNGYPVEYRFLLECQEADLSERYWQHPFPILDLSSLLVMTGSRTPKIQAKRHNPVDDAVAAANAAFNAFRLAGFIK